MWSDDKFHPSMQRSFYNDLECPQDEHDAKVRMQCHKHAVSDIELQKEAIESEIEIEKAQDVPYNGNKLERLQERKIKLINAKRYHQNASNAYWYYLQ
jgi:hypothetical protein